MTDTPALPEDQPHATIERVGRWTYSVEIHHGMIQWGPNGGGWLVMGRRRAERKGRKELRRYLREQGWRMDSSTVTL